jgi:hypothetical protein
MTQRNATIAQQIHQALTVLYAPDQVVELRIPKVDGKKRTDSGYFNDLNLLAIAAARYEGRAAGVYVTLNPVEPALLARAENRIQEWAELSTSDDYITSRRWLPIDCDPKVNGKKRPAGISSTEQEHESATRKAAIIREWLSAAGWPDPVEADSGNGAALLYAIDMPNSEDSKRLVEACLKALAQRFDDDTCDIDTTVHNAARIWKVYGTVAGKGDSTTDRPHRRAELTKTPYPIRTVPMGLLQTLAKTIEQPKPTAQPQSGIRTGIQAEQWLQAHNIAVSSTKPGNNGSTIYLLEECPFNADHTGSATVVQMASGALSFRCLHDSCKSYDWRALRSKFEPSAYEHRNGTTPAARATPATEKPSGAALRSETVMQTLLDLGYSFRLNLCDDTIEVNGRAIDNVTRAMLLTALHDRDMKGRATLEDTWTAAAAQAPYHPIKDYLNTCVWDGKPYIEELAGYFTCTDSPIIYHDGSSVPLVNVYLWRWLIGAVAKVFEQAQNLMLVMAGPQGSGKSSFVRWLCKSIPGAHIESPITVGDRDTDVRLMKYFLWEVSELDATTRKADVSALKAFITKQTVNARKAYGHYDTVKPATASLFGTVNDGSGFLADETGNRRFYVTTINKIDWRYTTLPIDQIWGQAVALWRRGEPWQLQPNELQAQIATNKQHEIDGLLDDWIQRYFILTGEDDSGMSAAEIVDYLRKQYDIRLTGSDRVQAMEIARVMTKLGIRKRQREGRGAREYIGVMPK